MHIALQTSQEQTLLYVALAHQQSTCPFVTVDNTDALEYKLVTDHLSQSIHHWVRQLGSDTLP